MTDIAVIVGAPEILAQTDKYTLFLIRFSDGSTSTETAWLVDPPILTQKAAIEQALAAADAGKITLSGANRAGLEIALSTAAKEETAL